MSDFWIESRGTESLFLLMNPAHTKLYEVIDLSSEYCEEVGCERCRFTDGVGCTMPQWIQGADAKDLLWLLDEANIGWELYEVFPNDPLPVIYKVEKGENYEYEYETV